MDFLQIKYMVLQNKATILKKKGKYFVWRAISPWKVSSVGLVWALLGGRRWPMLCEGGPYIAQVIGKQTARRTPSQPPPRKTEIKIHPKPASPPTNPPAKADCKNF